MAAPGPMVRRVFLPPNPHRNRNRCAIYHMWGHQFSDVGGGTRQIVPAGRQRRKIGSPTPPPAKCHPWHFAMSRQPTPGNPPSWRMLRDSHRTPAAGLNGIGTLAGSRCLPHIYPASTLPHPHPAVLRRHVQRHMFGNIGTPRRPIYVYWGGTVNRYRSPLVPRYDRNRLPASPPNPPTPADGAPVARRCAPGPAEYRRPRVLLPAPPRRPPAAGEPHPPPQTAAPPQITSTRPPPQTTALSPATSPARSQLDRKPTLSGRFKQRQPDPTPCSAARKADAG